MRPKLLIVDGASMLAIAYYAYMPNEIKFAKSDEGREKHYDKLLHAPNGIYTNVRTAPQAAFGLETGLSGSRFWPDQEHVPPWYVRRIQGLEEGNAEVTEGTDGTDAGSVVFLRDPRVF